MRLHRSLRAAIAVAAVGAFAALTVGVASAKPTAKAPKPDVQPRFGELYHARHGKAAFPTFSFSYTDPTDGITYPITMVGNDPRSGHPSTMKTLIIPLKMRFVAGDQDTSELNDLGYVGYRATALNHTFDGTRRVRDVLQSPIFANSKYPADMGGDNTQYGDAFMRAQFDGIRSGYHVRLQNIAVAPTQSVDVPAADGLAYQRPVGAWRTAHGMPTDTIAGVADFGWFANYIVGVMQKLNVGPDVVPIFLTDNVMLYDSGSYLSCCTIGFHGTPAQAASTASAQAADAQATLIYAAWSTPGTYSGFMTDYTGERSAPAPTRGIADIHALSHEVAEHLDDPFVNNAVTPWLTPTAPQYGCTPVLETGDPVVGDWFPLSGNKTGSEDGYQYYGQYHPEEEVFGQWYAHGAMEQLGFNSWDGRLTFMGPRTTSLGGPWADFGDYSHGC
jgi:hypothetical protein